MMSNMVQTPEQPLMEQVSTSPLTAQILEFCESDLFLETIQNSEVTSTSNCCYEERSSFPPDITKCSTTLVDNTTTKAASNVPTTNFSLVSKEEIFENNLSTPLDLTNSSHFTDHRCLFSNQDMFDLSLLQNHVPLTTNNNTTTNDLIFSYPDSFSNDHIVPVIEPTTLHTVCEDNLSSMPPSRFNNYLSPNCTCVDPSIDSYLVGSTECSRTFNGNLFLGNDLQPNELEFQGENDGIFCVDPLPLPYNSNELQALSNESQHLVNGGGNSTTALASEITSFESENLRVTNKLTSEERKEKIHRYMKKRNERNFSKKIKYACRKTLADSRPRVRGRFAKNDEFGEDNRTNSNHEEDIDEDHIVVKEEEDNLNFDSSDIFAHISGVNSFKCNYSIQSWI